MPPRQILQYRRACKWYVANHQAVDQALYALCRCYPDHQRMDGINAKLWIIGRTYATGIERKVKRTGFQGGSMGKLANWFWRRRASVDGIIRSLQGIQEPLTLDHLRLILDAHGRLVRLVQPALLKNQSPRSWASKYLHFHCPLVPIYDSIARSELRSLVPWDATIEVLPCPRQADERYWEFTLRFWHIYQQLGRREKVVSVKLVDAFLLHLARRRRYLA